VDYSPRLITLGALTRDYILSETGAINEDVPGGEAIYSAAGMVFAGEKPGLCARVGELYPQDWLEQFERKGIDISGVLIKPEIEDVIRFFVCLNAESISNENPLTHYARYGKPIPKSAARVHQPLSADRIRKPKPRINSSAAQRYPQLTWMLSAPICVKWITLRT